MFPPRLTSEMLEVSPSTLRRYNRHFRAHLSETAQRSSARRYTEGDIDTLSRARDLMRTGLSPSEVNERLPVVDRDQEAPSDALAMIPSISTALADGEARDNILAQKIEELDERLAEVEAKTFRPGWRHRLASIISPE